MAKYTEPTRMLMRRMVDDIPVSPGQVITRQEVMIWFATNYPQLKPGTITAHLCRLSTNALSRNHYSPKPGEDDLFYQLDGSHFRLYDPQNDPPPIRRVTSDGTIGAPPEEQVDEPTESEVRSFAYEADLRNFLAKNLYLLESGLRLFEDEGIDGVEYPAGGRFIDILAIDARGGFVVLELKVSRGYDRVVGQVRRYMGWIAKNLAEPGQPVRGFIVARELTEDLILACSGLRDVQ
ncbi:MAG TPA: endonuclease NucS domain-containing protein, partial [Bryobacteraceae bacterium]|nr:endonuclease NucS domain-containing protein [Bryobacteraceae bacterium]